MGLEAAGLSVERFQRLELDVGRRGYGAGTFRRLGVTNQDKASPKAIEDAIVTLLREREGAKTICPSEVARRLAPEQWRPLMPSVREVAARMALEGRLVATQKGEEVDALLARGPIRLKAMPSLLGDKAN